MVRNRSKEKVCLVCWSITGGGGFRGKNGGVKLEESLLNQLKKEKKDKECDLFGKILNKLIELEDGGTDGRVAKDGSDVSVCSNCKTLVSSAIESKCKTLEVGDRVEKLQQSILEELKELQLYLDIFYLQMKKIENVMGKNDVEDLSGLIPGESSGGGLKDELLHFRDSLAKVMSDFRFYRDNVKKPMATVAQEGSQNMCISSSSSLSGSPAAAASQNGQGRRPFLLTLTPLNGSSGTSLLRDSQMATGVPEQANNLASSTGISPDGMRVSSRNFSQNGNANITPATSKKSPPAVDPTTSILNNKNGNSKSIGKKTPSPSTVIDLSSDDNISEMDTSPSSTSSQSKQPLKVTISKPKAMQVNKDSSDAAVDNKSKTDSKKSIKRKLSEDKEYNSESDSEDSNDGGKKKKKRGRKSKKSKVPRKGTKVDSKTKAKVSPSSTTSTETKQKLEKGKETTLPAKQNIGVPIVRRVSSRRNSSTSLHSPTTTGIEAQAGIPNEEKTRKEITSSESGKTAQSVLKNGKKSLSPQQQNVPVTADVQCETNNGDVTKSVVQQKDSNQIYTCGLCPAQHQSEKEHMLHMEQHLTEDFQSDTASELGQEKEAQLVLVTPPPAPTHKNVEDTGSKEAQQAPPKPTETNSGYKSTVQDVDSVIEDLIGSQIEYHPSVIDSTTCISSAEKGGMRISQEKEQNEVNAAEEISSSSITIPGGESITTVACSSTSSAISPPVISNGSGKNQDGANGIATSDSPTSQSAEKIQFDMGPPVQLQLASEGNSKGVNADASISLCIQDDGKNFFIN